MKNFNKYDIMMPISGIGGGSGGGGAGGDGLVAGDSILSAADKESADYHDRSAGDVSSTLAADAGLHPLFKQQDTGDMVLDSDNSAVAITQTDERICYYDKTRSTWINVKVVGVTSFQIFLSDDFAYTVNNRMKVLNPGAEPSYVWYDESSGILYATRSSTSGSRGYWEITIDFDTIANTAITDSNTITSNHGQIVKTSNYFFKMYATGVNGRILRSSNVSSFDIVNDAIYDESVMEGQVSGSNFILGSGSTSNIILSDDTILFYDLGNRKIFKSDTIVMGSSGDNSTIREVFDVPSLEVGESYDAYIRYDGVSSLTVSTNQRIWKSIDKGETWSLAFNMPTPDCDLAIANPNMGIYVILLQDKTGFGTEVFVYTKDDGATWTELPNSSGFYPTTVNTKMAVQFYQWHNDTTTGDFALLEITSDDSHLYTNDDLGFSDNFTIPHLGSSNEHDKWNIKR